MDYSHVASEARRGARPRQAGLTLIELLVAISVLAFVAVMGWRGLDTIVRTRTALNEDLAQTRGMQLAFAQMQTDSAAIASKTQLPDRSPIEIGRDRLTLVRSTGGDGQPTRLQVITYLVRDGVLMRQESSATRDLAELGTLWSAALNDFNMTNAVVLQTGVASMTMRLWDERGWRTDNITMSQATTLPDGRTSRGEEERKATGAGPALNLPTGLEVALQLQKGEASMLKVFLLGAL